MVDVSVVLTSYNIEKYITHSLHSLVAQEFDNYEVIVVDDGSNDSTYQIIEKFAKEFNFIKPYKIPHQNAGVARNFALDKINGKYVIFLDGDDVFSECFLYKMFNKIEQEKAEIVICNSEEFIDDIKTASKKHSYENDIPIGWAFDKIIESDLIKKHNLAFSNLSSSNDLAFVYSAFFLSKKTVFIDETLVYKRIRQESISNNRDEKNAFLALIELKENLIKFDIFKKHKTDFQNIVLKFLYWHFNSYKTKEKRKKVYEYMKYFENEFDILRLKDIKNKKYFEFYKLVLNSKNYFTFCLLRPFLKFFIILNR